MSGTYPKVTSDLLLIKSKSFRMEISFDTEPAGKEIILCRKCN